ncbi:MAG: TIGR01777 family oxidoreductase [Bacteroidota bacterium]
MIVSVSGSNGFFGKSLLRKMTEKGWTVRSMDRPSFSLPEEEFRLSLIEGADVVINLAGAPVSKKWTPQYKEEIRESRISTTSKIATSILGAKKKPALFISASAIGIYDSVHTHTESSVNYSGSYLANVCLEWETEALKAETVTRVVIFRTGLVLGKNGGALEKMYLPFSIGAGGKIGSGTQAVSFIHLDDLVNAYIYTIENTTISQVVNAVAPNPTTNAELTDTFAKILNQPAWLTVPSFVLKFIYGEGACILLEGQKVIPEKLEKAGFRFAYPTVRNALTRIYKF